ncbi:hypothetical protein BCON_0940g00010 [Botryotinia convoluta]|uniref:Uncharacterized protein n=1 Tax=Botryotinia convoluta TaxID=54673 RepID=A0A4Z1H4U9_9HELO|nr:hypothetical protein BCON_0940g00010 [Botryotinia convoluta]
MILLDCDIITIITTISLNLSGYFLVMATYNQPPPAHPSPRSHHEVPLAPIILHTKFSDEDYKPQRTSGEIHSDKTNKEQTNLSSSVSNSIAIQVDAQQINLVGNNCIYICRRQATQDQDFDYDPELPHIFIAKEFGDNKDELETYERLSSLQEKQHQPHNEYVLYMYT